MMTKKTFKRILEEIESLEQDTDGLNEAFQKLDPDFNFISFSRHFTLMVDILKEAFNDQENDWIGYWIWELDFGKKAKPSSVTMKGKNVPIKTAGDLYRILTDKS